MQIVLCSCRHSSLIVRYRLLFFPFQTEWVMWLVQWYPKEYSVPLVKSSTKFFFSFSKFLVNLIHMHSRIIVTFVLFIIVTFVLFQNYVGNVNRWHFLYAFSIHSKSCRLVYLDKQKQTLILKISFLIISELHILREHTHTHYNASLLVPSVPAQLSLFSCKMSCFSFTFHFLSLSSNFKSYVFFLSRFLSGDLSFPRFTPPPALDLSSVLMCLTQCFFDSLSGEGDLTFMMIPVL